MIIPDRMAPEIKGDFVLFLIGMRVNRFHKVKKWWQVSRAMPRMIAELDANPDLGLLHTRYFPGLRNFMLLQYWQSLDKLMDYAHNPDLEHRPAWTEFVRNVGFDGDVGIWHETYHVKPGQVEAIYGNMPPFGLGQAFGLVKAEGTMKSAAGRMSANAAE